MQNSAVNDSSNNQIQQELDNFDRYIRDLTSNIKKKLDLSSNKSNQDYTSKMQEQAHILYDSLKTYLEKDIQKRKELLNQSMVKKKSLTKSAVIAGATGIAGTATVASGVAYLPKNTSFVAQNNAAAPSNEINTATPRVEAPTNNIGGNETGDHFLGTIGETAVIVGAGVVTVAGITLLGKATLITKECIDTHIKKHESEHISKYLKDNDPMIELIITLLTACTEKKLSKHKDLNQFDINRIAKKKCSLLMKNLVKLEKNKKKELPHLIADKLLCNFSFSDLYSLKEKESSLKHWLGALEQTINKKKHLTKLSTFLNELSELRDMTKQKINDCQKSLPPNSFFTSNKRCTTFSFPHPKDAEKKNEETRKSHFKPN